MNGSGGTSRALVLTIALAAAAPAAGATGDSGLLVPAPDRPSPWAVTFAPEAAESGVPRTPRLDLSTAGFFADATPDAAPPPGPPAPWNISS